MSGNGQGVHAGPELVLDTSSLEVSGRGIDGLGDNRPTYRIGKRWGLGRILDVALVQEYPKPRTVRQVPPTAEPKIESVTARPDLRRVRTVLSSGELPPQRA